MTIIVMVALALLRLTGFITEPRLSDEAIHAVAGERSRVQWTLPEDRPRRIVTWNIERGVEFGAVAAVLDDLDADIVLLQEVDRFCARSGYRDVARDLAVALRMNFATAGEFQEIGEGRRGAPCVTGQAVLSRDAIDDARALRFENQAALKWRINPAQPRRGGRVALRVSIGGVTAYSVHLESGADEALRIDQVRELLADAGQSDGPVMISGDFNNTGDPRSRLFFELSVAGFINALAGTAGPDARRRPIDWIFTRGIHGQVTVVGTPGASDHDPLVLVPKPSR